MGVRAELRQFTSELDRHGRDAVTMPHLQRAAGWGTLPATSTPAQTSVRDRLLGFLLFLHFEEANRSPACDETAAERARRERLLEFPTKKDQYQKDTLTLLFAEIAREDVFAEIDGVTRRIRTVEKDHFSYADLERFFERTLESKGYQEYKEKEAARGGGEVPAAEAKAKDLEGAKERLFAAAKAGCADMQVYYKLQGAIGVFRDTLVHAEGKTPLHWACSAGHAATVGMLVGHFRSNLAAKDNSGQTPLHAACAGGHASVCHLLLTGLQRPVGPEAWNCRDGSGLTPIMVAAAQGKMDAVRALTSAAAAQGIDLNASVAMLYPGMLALHLHSERGVSIKDLATDLLLCYAGLGRSALDLAQVAGRADIADVLRAAGAESRYGYLQHLLSMVGSWFGSVCIIAGKHFVSSSSGPSAKIGALGIWALWGSLLLMVWHKSRWNVGVAFAWASFSMFSLLFIVKCTSVIFGQEAKEWAIVKVPMELSANWAAFLLLAAIISYSWWFLRLIFSHSWVLLRQVFFLCGLALFSFYPCLQPCRDVLCMPVLPGVAVLGGYILVGMVACPRVRSPKQSEWQFVTEGPALLAPLRLLFLLCAPFMLHLLLFLWMQITRLRPGTMAEPALEEAQRFFSRLLGVLLFGSYLMEWYGHGATAGLAPGARPKGD